MRRYLIPAVLSAALLLLTPAPAAADLTGFLGATTTPATRPARGFAVGVSLLVVGFEFEYSRTSEQIDNDAPGLTTGMFNALVQTPTSGVQLYATIGGGFFRERLDTTQETSFGTNIGGGAKIRLAGPVRLRLDFRVFNLRGSALYPTPKRFYAGLNIAF
ncbi:MAG: hypothetical protein R2752_09550 [Vicinamibacterales bacterium]